MKAVFQFRVPSRKLITEAQLQGVVTSQAIIEVLQDLDCDFLLRHDDPFE
jgi:hypothetical protein